MNVKDNPSACTYPFCPTCMTLRSALYLVFIYLIPSCWWSIIKKQHLQCVLIVAFSADIRSAGSPSLLHPVVVASSVNVAIGSRPSITGTGTFEARVKYNKPVRLPSSKAWLSVTHKIQLGWYKLRFSREESKEYLCRLSYAK